MKKVTEVMGAIVLIVGSVGTIIASLVAEMAGGVGAFIIALLGGGVGVAVSASVFFALNEILVNQENIKNMIQQFNQGVDGEKKGETKKQTEKKLETEEITEATPLTKDEMLLNEIEKYDTAKEIYEYLLNIDSADKCLVEKVIPAVEKVVKFEKLYGNSCKNYCFFLGFLVLKH